MPQWFYRINGHAEFGPIGASDLLELIRQGQVDGQTEIRKDDSAWVLACEINGLWQAAGRPTVEFKCPYCESAIEKPPTWCKSCRKDVAKSVGQLVRHSRPKDRTHSWEREAVAKVDKPKAPPLQ
jgi:hypothetical protein